MKSPLLWHPNARRMIIPTAPQTLTFAPGGAKMGWHTTEGSTASGALEAYRDAGVCPHFTIMVKGGERTLYQHLPLNRAASALEHPSGTPETNRAGVNVQVEIVGFAHESGVWPTSMYRYLNLLARFVNRHCGVPLKEGLIWREPEHRLSGAEFVEYTGHYGHRHAPNQRQHHQDPGDRFHINYVLRGV